MDKQTQSDLHQAKMVSISPDGEVFHLPTDSDLLEENARLQEIVKKQRELGREIDCFGILSDAQIEQYFRRGCEVKGLGRGHIQRFKEKTRQARPGQAGHSSYAQ